MAKKKEARLTGRQVKSSPECDLDNGFQSPITSLKDVTLENIRSVLVSSRYVQALIVATIAGLFLRFYNLGYNSLWLDEASTYTISVRSLPEIWQVTAAGEFNPPLFYWIEHIMLQFGNNEIILRFIPALLGVLTIPLVYYIGKEFVDRNVGIIAAAGCAFSPFLIFYSQEARAYSVMLFFVAAAMIFYLRAQKTHDIKNWALFGVFSALAFWAHFYAFVIVAALFLYEFAMQVSRFRTELKNLKMLVLGAVVFIVLCLPLILVTIQLFITRTSSAPTYGIQGLGIITETFRQVSGFNDIAMFILVALFILGIIQAFFTDAKKGIFLVTLTVLTFVISFILSFKMPMIPRYLIFFSIVFFIGIALSYKIFYLLISNRAIVYGLVLALCVISAPTLAGYYSGYSKEDWRGFSGLIQQKTVPGDMVVLVPGYVSQPLDYYYSNATDKTFEYGAYTGQDLANIYSAKGSSTMYLVVTGDISAANPQGDALAWLNNNTRLLGQNTGIYLFTA